MLTRTQIDTWITTNKDTIKAVVVAAKVGEDFQQVKRWNDRDDVRVDVYDGPLGKGYSIVITATEGEDVYSKMFTFGPETRVHDDEWLLVQED